jgi:spermidine/putrescine transport system substrate-binding protein
MKRDLDSRLIVSRRRFLKTAIAASAGLSLSSCGWTLAKVRTDQVIKQSADTLYIYTWASYIDQELVNAFQSKTGIKVVFDIFSSNEEMLATYQAGKGKIYSVIYPSDYKVTQMIKLGYLQELNRDRLPSLNNLFPRFQQSVHDSGNRYSVPTSWGTTGLIYNSEKLADVPTDWNFLWQQKQKIERRVTLMDDVREVMGATLRSLGFSYNSTNPNELKQAYERLLELKPAIATFTTDAWKDQIIAGDLLIAMGYSSDASLVMRQNPKLKYVIPKSGTSLWGDTMVIPKTAPNPDAAYEWINFLLQPEIAAKLTERLLFATPNQAAFQQLPEGLRSNPSLFPSEPQLKSAEAIVPVDKSVLELYEQYWTKLSSN